MSNRLAEAVAELHLEPGQTYRTTVDDVEVQFHRSAALAPKCAPAEQEKPPSVDPSEEEPSQFADMVMLDLFLDVPPSPRAITVKARFGPHPPPDPPVVPPDDEVFE